MKAEVPRYRPAQPNGGCSDIQALLGNRAFGAGQGVAMALSDLSLPLGASDLKQMEYEGRRFIRKPLRQRRLHSVSFRIF